METPTPPVIALITDFGLKDWYVGSIKGMILSYCPEATIVDISHSITPGDIYSAGYVLASCINDFPDKTIFVAVVDPGVGTDRKAIMGRIGKHTVICPNNGLITHCYEREADNKGPFYEILPHPNDVYKISATFHGRDIFAPIAGKIAAGKMNLDDLGNIVSDVKLFDLPQPDIKKGVIKGAVRYTDQFGNLITNISQTELGLFKIRSSAFLVVNDTRISLRKTFGEVSVGEPLTYIGSNGYVEIAVNQAHAGKKLGIKVGTEVLFYPEANIHSDLPVIRTKPNNN